MIWVFIIIAAWLTGGILTAGWAIFLHWQQGKDLTVGEFFDILRLAPYGWLPMARALCDIVVEKIHDWVENKNNVLYKDWVILSGSKNAKMYKAITNDKWHAS